MDQENNMAPKPPIRKNFSYAFYTSDSDDKYEEVFKSHMRDLSIDIVSNSTILSIDSNRRFDRWQFLRKNNKIIKYALSIGGVLTGSRALKCYKYKGKFLFDRKSRDWDILVTEDMIFKIADKFGFNYNLVDKSVLIQSDRWSSYSSYSSMPVGRILKNDINLIIKDELIDYNTVDDVKISKLLPILNSKKELSSNNRKHREDISKIITRINAIKLNG